VTLGRLQIGCFRGSCLPLLSSLNSIHPAATFVDWLKSKSKKISKLDFATDTVHRIQEIFKMAAASWMVGLTVCRFEYRLKRRCQTP
jgi:hypothetical protein